MMGRLILYVIVSGLLMAGFTGVAQAQERQVVALVVPMVDVYDDLARSPQRVSRNNFQMPLRVLEERQDGFVRVQVRDKAVWLDSAQVKMNGARIKCAPPVSMGLQPLGTMGAGDSCK